MQQGDASLEEILASIKVMMARDDAERRAREGESTGDSSGALPASDNANPVDNDEGADVLDLGEANMLTRGEDREERQSHAPVTEALTRPATTEAIRQTLAALDLLGGSKTLHADLPEPATLETLARAMLRPMLIEWLEANLPALVERLVQAEIARIVAREG